MMLQVSVLIETANIFIGKHPVRPPKLLTYKVGGMARRTVNVTGFRRQMKPENRLCWDKCKQPDTAVNVACEVHSKVVSQLECSRNEKNSLQHWELNPGPCFYIPNALTTELWRSSIHSTGLNPSPLVFFPLWSVLSCFVGENLRTPYLRSRKTAQKENSEKEQAVGGLTFVINLEDYDWIILSDSKAAILSIVSKHTPSSQTAEITKMLSQLISLNKRIVFQWIPSHCGILGNENVDALATKGSTATYRPVTKSTYYSVKRFIKSTYLDVNKQNLITQSQGKKWNSLHQNSQLIPDLPRKSSVAAFRLATGHDCLAKHLHKIGIYQSPNCPLCNSNQEMDSEHLKICASLAGHDNIFEKYWNARGQMTLLLNAWH
ncbi:hypothetical protein ANN_04738 [Periplaneta americana]|uniref:RNase H type-1 domain-containing protein n=1 Tax=Periplaneta americana TaxID=6978 RepID=A0ABQ8TAX3_PERAM|nr:hypothetical protein ANN_04738 [Periplaneta americana]